LTALRAESGKDIGLFGGGSLFRSLPDAGLVDTVEVAIMPVLLGGGIPLFPPPTTPAKLNLTDHNRCPHRHPLCGYPASTMCGTWSSMRNPLKPTSFSVFTVSAGFMLPAFDGQVGQVGADLFRTHVFRVGPPAVELDEAADGEQVGFLGPVTQMLEPHDLAASVQEGLNRHGAASGQGPG
jgi:RibD C-terminal domain